MSLGVTLAGTGVGPAGVVRASGADDDLAVVKRAVAHSAGDAPPARPEAKPKAEPPGAHAAARPRWLRIRVADKGERKGNVSINVPLGLVQAMGDDWPLDLHCGRHREEAGTGDRCRLRLSEVLAALRSGQDLVEIDDDDTTVRVWVD
jgi:hypothetical protein